ncbi:MAG: hypothetical protein Q8M02_14005 [Candidatus Didemnitutus sp.]|nr:hypothetical protein [Candidatus Didemnitutus sp.]
MKSGNGQKGIRRQLLMEPLVVQVSKPDGSPWPNAPVTYSALDNSKLGSSLLDALSSTVGRITVRTDSEGIAKILVRYEQ